MGFNKVTIGSVAAAALLGYTRGFPPCRDDQYWFSITGNCEPCSRICDPPEIHENDCPKFCPNYHYTTTTIPPTTTALSVQSMSQGPGQTGEGLSPIVLTIICVVAVLVFNLLLGCLVYKKRESLKNKFPLKQMLGKIGYKTTTQAVQPGFIPDNTDPEQQEGEPMIEQPNKDGSSETVNEVDLR